MNKQSTIFNGIATQRDTEQHVRIEPYGSYSGREIDWNQNMRQINDNTEAHRMASGKHNQDHQDYYSRTMQQKAGLGIRPICTPTNYQGVKSIPYRGKTNVPVISGSINTSTRKIPEKEIIPSIEPYPRQYLP